MEQSVIYEYKSFSLPERNVDLDGVLNEHGKQGWRLVQTIEGMGYTSRLIFERVKTDES